VKQGRQALRQGDFRQPDGGIVPVAVSAVGLSLMGKWFVQSVVRDVSTHTHLEQLLAEKEQELAALRATLGSTQ